MEEILPRKSLRFRTTACVAVVLSFLVLPLSGDAAEARSTVRLDGRELFEITGEDKKQVTERV